MGLIEVLKDAETILVQNLYRKIIYVLFQN